MIQPVAIELGEYARLVTIEASARHFVTTYADLAGMEKGKPPMFKMTFDHDDASVLFFSALVELDEALLPSSVYTDKDGLRKAV